MGAESRYTHVFCGVATISVALIVGLPARVAGAALESPGTESSEVSVDKQLSADVRGDAAPPALREAPTRVTELVAGAVGEQGIVTDRNSENLQGSAESIFAPLTPARLLDTRSGDKVGELDGSGAVYELQVAGSGGVPSSGVSAVALNVTAVSAEASDVGGFVTVFPCGTRPDASNLNFTSGMTIANSVIAPVSGDGKVCFYVYGKAHLLADVSGYFSSGSQSLTPPSLDVLMDLPPAEMPLVDQEQFSTGDEFEAVGRGFYPGEVVQLIIASEPQVIAETTSGSDGSVSVSGSVPDDMVSGSHNLMLFAPISGIGFRQSILISTETPAVNDVPVAVGESVSTAEDAAVDVDVLANDVDVDGDVLSVVIVDSPSSGSLSAVVDGVVTYTPDANFAGSDAFTYRVSDGELTSDVVTVSVTVSNLTVSVIASDPFAFEGESTGTFVVSRNVSSASSLTIGFSTSGTATETSDFDALPGSVTIPANEHSVSIVVNPMEDNSVEGTETLTVTLASSSSYALDVQSATISIRDAFDGAGVGAIVPVDETFELESLPGARHTLYIDVHGGTYCVYWPACTQTVPIDPYDSDGDGLSNEELGEIQQIWRQVSEDFLPFNINVTLKEPAAGALTKDDEDDLTWGSTVLIAGTQPSHGFAWSGGEFNRSDNYPGYVSRASWPIGVIAAGISHEAAHAMGLDHDGTYSKGPGSYYDGHDGGTSLWVPIMGTSTDALTQWAEGSYSDANEQQDDLAILANSTNGFGYRADDHSAASANATALVELDDGFSSLRGEGIIERNTDEDVFSFTSTGGSIVVSLLPAEYGPNLDISAELLNSDGATVALSAPVDDLSAQISTSLSAGEYFIKVSGDGNRTWADGYDDYGSLGEYSIMIGVAEVAEFDPSGSSADTPVTGNSAFESVTLSDLSGVNVGSASYSGTMAAYWTPSGSAPRADQYLSFSVTVDSGNELLLQSLSASFYQWASNSNVAVRWSTDGFISDLAPSQRLSGQGSFLVNFDLSEMPAVTGPVEFRIYVYDDLSNSAGWRYLTGTSYSYSSDSLGLVLTGAVNAAE